MFRRVSLALLMTAGVLLFGCCVASAASPRHVKYRRSSTAPRPATRVVLPFTDGFEGTFPGSWTHYGNPHWGTTTYKKNAGTKSVYCVQSTNPAPGPYPAYADAAITYGAFSTLGATSGQVTFKLWASVEAAHDRLTAAWSLDDINYEGLVWETTTSGWLTCTVKMNEASFATNYLNRASVYFSLEFTSDANNAGGATYEGMYVDDVSIATGGGASTGAVRGIVTGPAARPLRGVCMSYTSGATPLAPEKYTNSAGSYRWDGLAGGYRTVTPRKPGYTFVPASRSLSVYAGQEAVADFTAVLTGGVGAVARYAVLVGISDYEGTANDLDYCDDDAVDMKNALLANGWPTTTVRTLLNSQATKANIQANINWLCTAADANDVVLVQVSGHGSTRADAAPMDEGDGLDECLCPYNLSGGDITDDELSLWFSKLRTRKYMVLLDTCYSGGQVRAPRQLFDLAPERSAAMHTRDLDDLDGGVVVTACRDNELSEEDGTLQNGVFTYYLVEGMNNGYADMDQSGSISAEELFAYAGPRASEYDYNQTATLYDGYPGELDFATLPTLVSASTPARDATTASRTANLSITWRWNVNQASAQTALKLKDASGRVIAGAYAWTTAKKVMTFNPTPTLAADSQYTVEVAPGLLLDDGTTKWYGDKITYRTTASASPPLRGSGVAQMAPNGGAQISLSLSGAATVNAVVCNIAGRTIAVLGETVAPAGVSTLLWSGRSASGLATPAGQYLVRAQARDDAGNTAAFVVPLRK